MAKRKRKTRRTRSPHPGVIVFARKAEERPTSWRARWAAPETGRWKFENLSKLGLGNADQRTAWAIDKSESLRKRLAEIKSGAPRVTTTPLDHALQSYFEAAENRLRESTIAGYVDAVSKFTAWAEREGIRHVEEISPAHLAQFREAVIARKRKTPIRGRKVGRGKWSQTDRSLSPASRNSILRATSAALNRLRKLGKTPLLNRDTIAESLERLPVPKPQIEALRPQELRALLRAALRHDAACWNETRAEHVGARPKGTTPRYEAVTPLVVVTMLTGMRIGEAVGLLWSDVDLDAVDNHGNAVGKIRLGAESTKTNTARRILLEVSPRLRALLQTLKMQAGGELRVFHNVNRADADNALDRLKRQFGAPEICWQDLRKTCGSYLTNAPSIFGAASAFLSAKQLGHSVAVAEKHYIGVVDGIPRDARTLDAAMQIEAALDAVVAVTARTASSVALPQPVVALGA